MITVLAEYLRGDGLQIHAGNGLLGRAVGAVLTDGTYRWHPGNNHYLAFQPFSAAAP